MNEVTRREVKVAVTCRYCHTNLPQHVSLAAHYATCPVLGYCLEPATPFPGGIHQISEPEKASRADEVKTNTLARARLQAEKHR